MQNTLLIRSYCHYYCHYYYYSCSKAGKATVGNGQMGMEESSGSLLLGLWLTSLAGCLSSISEISTSSYNPRGTMGVRYLALSTFPGWAMCGMLAYWQDTALAVKILQFWLPVDVWWQCVAGKEILCLVESAGHLSGPTNVTIWVSTDSCHSTRPLQFTTMWLLLPSVLIKVQPGPSRSLPNGTFIIRWSRIFYTSESDALNITLPTLPLPTPALTAVFRVNLGQPVPPRVLLLHLFLKRTSGD